MQRRLEMVVDIMRVPAEGDTTEAIVVTESASPAQDLDCEILVVGGGTGGAAAAWAAARQGRDVCLLEETDWLGGQFTSQGVSALDEHEFIEDCGGTQTYYALRASIRAFYQAHADEFASASQPNPGNCWVSRLAFEPEVAESCLRNLIRPHIEAGRLRVFLRHKIFEVATTEDRIESVAAIDLDSRETLRFHPEFVLDASELGDLLPLAGTDYTVGAEAVSETDEPHAQPVTYRPHCVQSFTYTFAMSRLPTDRSFVSDTAPTGYQRNREDQPYTLRIFVHGGEIYSEDTRWLQYSMFDQEPNTKGSLWEYRRLIDATQFKSRYSNDISLFNWPSIDYYRERSILDDDPVVVATALQEAKQLSLGFAHWIQTEVDKNGYPNLRVEASIMGTQDGLSKYPYIREGRRIRALFTVREQDVGERYQEGPRGVHFDDSVGLGWYPIDIHKAGDDDVGVSTRTRPFQIPLGSLIPASVPRNVIAAGKNIGVTHITNGCYRLHPVEWNIGEVAGLLAAFCCDRTSSPESVWRNPAALRLFQLKLLREGIPLYWLRDIRADGSDRFLGAQVMAMAYLAAETRETSLEFEPDYPVTVEDVERIAVNVEEEWGISMDIDSDERQTRGSLATQIGLSERTKSGTAVESS